MTKEDIENAIRNLLIKTKKPITESDIERKTKINYWDIVETIDSFKKRGMVKLVR